MTDEQLAALCERTRRDALTVALAAAGAMDNGEGEYEPCGQTRDTSSKGT